MITTQESRKNEIFVWVMANPNKTEGEIANGVGLKRTPYSRKLLLELVNDGSLVRSWDANRLPAGYVFYVQQTDELPL